MFSYEAESTAVRIVSSYMHVLQKASVSPNVAIKQVTDFRDERLFLI